MFFVTGASRECLAATLGEKSFCSGGSISRPVDVRSDLPMLPKSLKVGYEIFFVVRINSDVSL
jgi:hypothetical protein